VICKDCKDFASNTRDAAKRIIEHSDIIETKFCDVMKAKYPGYDNDKTIELSLKKIVHEPSKNRSICQVCREQLCEKCEVFSKF
jgi:hypothetical protein